MSEIRRPMAAGKCFELLAENATQERVKMKGAYFT